MLFLEKLQEESPLNRSLNWDQTTQDIRYTGSTIT